MPTPSKTLKSLETALPTLPITTENLVWFVPLTSWIKSAAICGFGIDDLLRDIGTTIDPQGAFEVTMTHEQINTLVKECVARSLDKHFPLVFGENFALESVPEIAAFLATCSSLRETMMVFDWMRILMSTTQRVTLHETGRLVQLRVNLGKDIEPDDPNAYFTETWLAAVNKMIIGLVGEKHVEAVWLKRKRPLNAVVYSNFFATETNFGMLHNAIILRRELLDRPLPGTFPELRRSAEERIKQRISRLQTAAGLKGQLERLFVKEPALLSQGIEESAAILGLHVRTLQRRLQEEEQNFAELQASIRFQLASSLLLDTELGLESISDKLGFSERRAFTRAFTRWAGVPPSVYRRTKGQ